MGIMKQWQLEKAEEEYSKHIKEVQDYLDANYPEEDWDAEVWIAFNEALDKDD